MDLDGDGIKDVISGSWPGELFFFKGRGNGQFDDRVKLKFKDGKTINIGGGVQRNDDREILIAGDATFENKDGKNTIVYEGQRYDATNKSGGITGTASAVFAADLDNDGDLDLIVGNIRGEVWVVPNEGTAKEWAFGTPFKLKCGGGTVHVEGDAGPYVGDWNGDGKPDLLVGSGDGSVQFYRNTGGVDPRTHLPIFAAAKELVPKADVQFGENASKDPTPGIRKKVCIFDYNGDSLPDLIAGDFTTQKPNRPDPTPAEKAEQEKIKAELKPLEERYSPLSQKLFTADGPQMTPQEREKTQQEFSALQKQMSDLRQKLPQEYEEHGWVWVYLRKPDAAQQEAGAAGG